MLVTAQALLDEHVKPTRDDVLHYLRGSLCRCTGYRKIVDAILAAAEAPREPARPAARRRQPVARVDGIEKVTGRVRYVTDLALPGMVHAKVLRSPHPHARSGAWTSPRARGPG